MKEVSAALGDVTDDAFLGGALRILQPSDGYRAGIDAVLLAAAAPVRAGRRERVLDAGAGAGVVGLAVAWRAARAEVTLVEREPRLVKLARGNATRNGLHARVRVLAADLTRRLDASADLRAAAGTFDHVLANPPYNPTSAGTVSRHALKAGAHAMREGDLSRWARFMAAMVRPGGTATMINRADALDAVLAAFAGRFGGLLVYPLFARAGKSAIRVLVQGIKGSSAPTELSPGLVLHGPGHGFRQQVEAILRGGEGLSLREPGAKKAAGP